MKRLLKRWVACSLSLMIMLHSTFLSVFADDVPLPVEYIDDVILSEDINVNPEDYVINSGVSTLSLGVTLTIGQIAALIAGGAGAIYAVSNFDDLGVHLDNALNTAAAAVENGREAYMSWLANAVNGNIALASAPSWIAQTILQCMHGLVTSVSPLFGQFDFQGFDPPVSGQILPAYQKFYTDMPYYSNGVLTNAMYKYLDFDAVIFRFVTYYYDSSLGRNAAKLTTVWGNSDGSTSGKIYQRHNASSTGSNNYWSDGYSNQGFHSNSNGRLYYKYTTSKIYLHTPENQSIFDTYILPGAICYDSSLTVNEAFIDSYVDSYLNGDVIDGVGAMPKGDEVSPDVLVGGLPEVWVGQGLGADVVTMPDIDLDGSDLINVGDQTALDTSIGTTMDKLATGELTWDDYWLDISGSGPLVDVGEGEGEDVGPPLQLPDWFKDWCKDITGTELDRNSEIDSMLPDLDEGMGQIDDFSASIGDQLKTEFDALHIENFALSTSVLLAIGWIAGWVTQFFNASGEAQVVVLLPMFIGLALLFIGRGSVAMSRVHSSHQHDTRKAAVSSKKGGGTP